MALSVNFRKMNNESGMTKMNLKIKMKRLIVPDSKIYFRDTEIKALWRGPKNRQVDKYSRLTTPTNPNRPHYIETGFRKEITLQVLEECISFAATPSQPYTKINCRQIKEQNMKSKDWLFLEYQHLSTFMCFW